MEYTKESLKGWGKSIAGLGGDTLLNYASAWEQEVAELRELCGLLNISSTGCASEKQDDRISELWAKHMKGGEG